MNKVKPNALSKEQIKQKVTNKSRCLVRECDETEKGKFIAYVDEKNDSYDVSINLDAEKNLIEHSCDCGSEKICTHVTALFQHVVTKQPAKLKPGGGKKKGLQLVLENSDPDRLKDWLWQLISANEEVRLLFTSEFNNTEQYNAGKVKELVRNTRKAIAGNVRYPAPKLVMKYLQSLVAVQKPVIQFYLEAPFDKEYIAVLKAVLEELDELAPGIKDDLLIKYYTELLTPIARSLRGLKDEVSFHLAVGYLMSGLRLSKPSGVCVIRVFSLLIKTTSFSRAYNLIKELAHIFGRYFNQKNDYLDEAVKCFHECLVYYNLLSEFGANLPVGSLDEKVNKEILEQSITSGDLENASERFWTAYENTATADVKLLLLQQLKNISIELDDESEILKVLEILVPLNYDYDDFVLLQKYMPTGRFTVLKQKMMTTASRELRASLKMFRFFIQVSRADKKYKKILGILSRTKSYQAIASSFESLIEFDSVSCLERMFMIHDDLGFESDYNANHDEFESVKRLVKITLKCCPENQLRSALKRYDRTRNPHYRGNYFTRMLTEAVMFD